MKLRPLSSLPAPGAALGAALLLSLGAMLSGCDEGCVGGDESCRVPSPCAGLSYSCSDGTLELRELDQQAAALSRRGTNALASRGDVLLGNDQIVAVVSGLGHQNYLDPSGGTLLDLRTRDGADGLVQSLPVVGILPRDSASYTELVLIDERPRRVAVQLRGKLLDQPETAIYTLYEIRPCEPGVRVRTEVVNGTPDPQLWALTDGFYWSGRDMLPFAPAQGLGFSFPSFGLLSIDDAFREAPLLAASTHNGSPASYALLSCSGPTLSGVNSPIVSIMGLRKSIVGPRDYRVFERFLAVTGGGDAASAIDVALRARSQLSSERVVQLRGRIELQGRPGALIDGERGASALISSAGPDAASRIPRTQIVPSPDGSFAALVPAGGDYLVEVQAFGRKVAERAVSSLDADRDLGAIAIQAAALVQLRVEDMDAAAPIDAEIFLVAADEATRSAAEGTFHGQYDRCAPWLGVSYGPSPACNRALVPRAGAQIEVPPGRYHLYAYHGPFYTIARQTVTLAAGDQTPLVFRLRSLPLAPTGTVSADLHVHGAASFDSSLPDRDRVLSFSAADVGVIIATDHDVVYDYGPVIAELGLADRLSAVSGVETTGHIPFLKAPGNDFPLVIGHYNFWPLLYQPGLPRNGGPYDEFVEPGELFDRVDALYQRGRVSIAQLNHPWADPEFGRDLGFPRAIGLNLLDDLPDGDDGTPGGLYGRSPRGGHRNDDHQAQEVMNGTQNDLLLTYRAFWFYLLNQGRLRTGTANSDSHGLTDNTVGSPRNLVFAGTQAGPAFDVDRFNQAIRDGAVLGTNGPVILATVDAEGLGEVPFGLRPLRPAAGGKLRIEISAAPWVPIDEVRLVVNGQVVRRIDGTALSKPADPFGSTGLLRYKGELALGEILPPVGDAWLVIEAGSALPLAGDLGGGAKTDAYPEGRPDGIPDTTDNNGDGKVDRTDVAPGSSVGPLKNPPAPQPGDDRYHFAQVVSDGYPAAFTNPFIFDLDGDGRFRPLKTSAQGLRAAQGAQVSARSARIVREAR